MKTAIVTSMDEAYFDKCGQSMLLSYLKYQKSEDIPLYLYNEGDFDVPKGIKKLGFELGSEFDNFNNRHSHRKSARKRKFAKKGFSIIHAMDNIPCTRLMWLDADTLMKKPMSENFLSTLCNSKTLSAHFSVWHNAKGQKWHSCETGFFLLNKAHKHFDEFKNTYKDIYYNDNIEGMRRFYDGEVYGKTVTTMANCGYKLRDLNTAKNKSPIGKSVLKDYIDHFKAKSGKVKLTNEILIGRHNL